MMMKFRSIVLLLLAISFVAASCNRKRDPDVQEIVNFFPVDQGRAWVYHRFDTVYNTTSATGEGSSYIWKEEINGTEQDLLDRTIQRLNTHISPDTIDSLGTRLYYWNFNQVWTVYKDDNIAERQEGNERYVILKYPVYPGLSWNGNMYNGQGAKTYRYLSVDSTVTVNGKTYEHCLVVLKQPYEQTGDMISQTIFIERYAYEIYAPGIGKIKRYDKNIQINWNQGQAEYTKDSRVLIETLL